MLYLLYPVLTIAAIGWPDLVCGQSAIEIVYAVGEADGEVAFQRIADVVADDAMNLFVLDRGLRKIFQIDSTGRVSKPFGGEGRGPGEMVRPTDLFLLGDTLGVVDPGVGRVTFYSKVGDVLRSERMSRVFGASVAKAQPMESGVWILEPGVVARVSEQLPEVAIVASRDGQWDTLASYHTATIQVQLRDESPQPFGVGDFGPGGFWSTYQGRIVTLVNALTGERNDFELGEGGVLDHLGTSVLPIATRAVTQDDRATARAKVAVGVKHLGYVEREIKVFTPDFWSGLSDLFYDSDGALWVNLKQQQEDSVSDWIAFERSGSVSRFVMPQGFKPYGATGEFVYGVFSDSLDVESVRVYRR